MINFVIFSTTAKRARFNVPVNLVSDFVCKRIKEKLIVSFSALSRNQGHSSSNANCEKKWRVSLNEIIWFYQRWSAMSRLGISVGYWKSDNDVCEAAELFWYYLIL